MHRIRLENEEFEGRNNAYLLTGDGPTVLVDTGVATEDTLSQLEWGLAEAELDVEDIDVVVLTHWHSDHSGLAGHVQSVSGATVYAHEADVPVIEGNALTSMEALHRERFDEWAVPEEKRAENWEIATRAASLSGDSPAVEPLVDGDRIEAGDESLRVLHAPGHTAGLVALVVEGTDAAIVGDAVLPVYTPNIGGADLRVERPLATYRNSLERLAEADFDRLYPGHRDDIEAPNDRITEILHHHEERTERVVDVLGEHGPATAWEVSAELFGELSGIHILHGPGEAYAHLVELEADGYVERSNRQYRLLSAPDAEGAR